MNRSVNRLNQLSAQDAEIEFLKCCGSTRWARALACARPFASVGELFAKADDISAALTDSDWLESFRAHPKIGEKKAAQTQSHEEKNWSAQEQSGVQTASPDTMA